jgi:hypothetical protein
MAIVGNIELEAGTDQMGVPGGNEVPEYTVTRIGMPTT